MEKQYPKQSIPPTAKVHGMLAVIAPREISMAAHKRALAKFGAMLRRLAK